MEITVTLLDLDDDALRSFAYSMATAATEAKCNRRHYFRAARAAVEEIEVRHGNTDELREILKKANVLLG